MDVYGFNVYRYVYLDYIYVIQIIYYLNHIDKYMYVLCNGQINDILSQKDRQIVVSTL